MRVRLIGLDQFEYNSYGNTPGLFSVMTQTQIDWFVEVLSGSHEFDGIIVLTHMGFGNAGKGQRDTSNRNAFISELAYLYDNSYDFYGPEDPYLIPEIVEAYRTGENITKTYHRGSNHEIKVETSFDRPANNFIGYFGGHLHWDEIEYLQEFPAQLQCLIAFCGSGTGSKWNDLTKKDYNYNFNIVDFDPAANSIRIVRHGASETVSGNRREVIDIDRNQYN